MARLNGELEDGWVLLRVKANSGAPGGFADDTDFAGTNASPPSSDLIAVPAQNSGTSEKTQAFQIMLVAVTTADVAVARGTFTCTVTAIEVGRTVGNETAYGGTPEFVSDSAPLAAVTLNRKIDVPVEKGTYSVRLTTFANIPGTANEIRIYAKAG